MISQEMHERLSAYLDGELDAEAREEMARLLEEQPELRAALEQMRRVDDLVRRAAPEAPAGLVRDTLREIDEAVPTRVKVRFRGADEAPRRRSPAQYLAAAVMLCAGMAALYYYQTQSARTPRDAEMLMAREVAGAPAKEPPSEGASPQVYRLEMIEETPKGLASALPASEGAEDALGAAVAADLDTAKAEAESLPQSAPPAPGSGGGASATPQEAAPLAQAASAEQGAPAKVTRNRSLMSKSSAPEAGEAGRSQTSPTAPAPAPAPAPPTAQNRPPAPAQSPASPKPSPPDGGGIHSGVALGRVVEGKVFLQTPDGWMERGYAGEKVTELFRGDEAFKKLLAEHPAVDKISALGGVVLFRFDTTWYYLTGGEANPES